MSRSNPIVDRGTFFAVAKSFLLARDSFFRLDLPATLTDPHFLRWLCGLALYTLFDFSSAGKSSKENAMLSFTGWAIDRAEEVMMELPTSAASTRMVGCSCPWLYREKQTPPLPGRPRYMYALTTICWIAVELKKAREGAFCQRHP